MRTEIKKINCDWREIKNECRATVGKEDTDKTPTKDFIIKLLISEHSPIRLATIKWRWKNIKSWVAGHFVRHHIGVEKWVSTQRSDRTGIDRHELPQDAPVTLDMIANAQALINMSRFRLCFKAAPETRKQMEDLKKAIHDAGQVEIARCMQPNCIYRCGCPEFESCGYWKRFTMLYGLFKTDNIQLRYQQADDFFYTTR